MKIVVKRILLTSALCVGFVVPALAETTVLDLANKTTGETIAATAATAPALPAINAPTMPVESAMKAAVPLDNPGRTVGDKDVPEQVQSVVDRLRGAKVDLSLEDMNQARAALARLDLLLQLEGKMQDLQAARQKSQGGDISSLLPKQVAGTMMQNVPAPIMSAAPVEATPVVAHVAPRPPVVVAQYEIQRIVGVNGQYNALLRSIADGKTQMARMGDKLTDGSEVLAVTSTAVRLRDSGSSKIRTVVVENVSAMSGGRGAY